MAKSITVLIVVLAVTAACVPAIVVPIHHNMNANSEVTINLIYNAGVMIEAMGLRIYIDPINLPSNYSDYPADAVLITHPHEDHYMYYTVNMLQKEDTLNVFPAIMTTAISTYNGLGVVPEDEFSVGSIKVTAFYMYTLPVDPYPASHPRESNFTSYLIDINGFTIFHAGDSKTITEYNDIAELVDVALLPIGPGCQTMADYEIVQALNIIKPSYFIPIHFEASACDSFISTYSSMITNCEIIQLDYYSIHKFNIN